MDDEDEEGSEENCHADRTSIPLLQDQEQYSCILLVVVLFSTVVLF